ncbi:hypothetical protein P154DRAFT_526816 [Amniculicola lignicola CBS 123094]|uniref:Uncharacterized protein n=1 Tax=Amniculicola lignicola CBS 123094 TaxID=1392246 RepID=A0A6A5W1L1_9PLEO|nr:hypothetical protein P154DRAFT_526816 [Amniculicola lignicola CBS 123094]
MTLLILKMGSKFYYPGWAAGTYSPFYVVLYEVLPLMSLNRDDKAIVFLQDTID